MSILLKLSQLLLAKITIKDLFYSLNGLPHAEVAAHNNADVLGCQAESSKIDRSILWPTPGPSGNLGRGFSRPAWGCWPMFSQHFFFVFFLRADASSRLLPQQQLARSSFYFFGFIYLLSISESSAFLNGLHMLAIKPYSVGFFITGSSA